jgi:hypothetical protein
VFLKKKFSEKVGLRLRLSLTAIGSVGSREDCYWEGDAGHFDRNVFEGGEEVRERVQGSCCQLTSVVFIQYTECHAVISWSTL